MAGHRNNPKDQIRSAIRGLAGMEHSTDGPLYLKLGTLHRAADTSSTSVDVL
jgi:hypothetical protein